MPDPIRVQAWVDVPIDAKGLAEIFAAMNDEGQAQFFIEVAAIAKTWRNPERPRALVGMQWFSVGRHLRDCKCSTEEARDLVREIASALEAS